MQIKDEWKILRGTRFTTDFSIFLFFLSLSVHKTFLVNPHLAASDRSNGEVVRESFYHQRGFFVLKMNVQ